jgi:hypothetical protein
MMNTTTKCYKTFANHLDASDELTTSKNARAYSNSQLINAIPKLRPKSPSLKQILPPTPSRKWRSTTYTITLEEHGLHHHTEEASSLKAKNADARCRPVLKNLTALGS